MADEFAERRRKKRNQEVRESFDAFEDDLSFEEYEAASRDFLGDDLFETDPAGQTTAFSNEKRKASEFNQKRSQNARASDTGKLAPLTTSVKKWKSDPDGLDFPGVDTPADEDLTDLF